jgi:hypothetical protein
MPTEIPVSGGLVALVDNEDVGRVAAFSWYPLKNGGKTSTYANGYLPRSKPPQLILMHRLILDPPDGLDVDHINGDGLDNRRSKAENNWNTGKQRSAKVAQPTSGFKGVYLRRDRNRWRATISANGKRISLGYFATAEEAARAYNQAAPELHGAFARLNVIP